MSVVTPLRRSARLAARTQAARSSAAAAHYQNVPATGLRATSIAIDRDALARNLRAFRERVGDRLFTLVVKANAYGHGAVEVATVGLAHGADRLAVACVSEAIELRRAGITAPILVLGATTSSEARDIVAFDLQATVATIAAADALDAAARAAGTRVVVHVKVNVGMNRLGIAPDGAETLLRTLRKRRALDVEGIFTHFPSAATAPEETRAQLARFERMLDGLADHGLRPPIAHAANSAATLFVPEARLDMVRAGGAVHGLAFGFGEPTLTWRTEVTQVNDLEAGEAAGYDGQFRATEPRRIAAIAAGWVDGLLRNDGGWRAVLVGGKRAPVVGLCMDQALIDVTEVDGVDVGDEVVLIGKQGDEHLTAAEAASWFPGLTGLALVAMLNQRNPSSTLGAALLRAA